MQCDANAIPMCECTCGFGPHFWCFYEGINDTFEPTEHRKDTSESTDMDQTTVESQDPKEAVQRPLKSQRPEFPVGPSVSSRGRMLKRPSSL